MLAKGDRVVPIPGSSRPETAVASAEAADIELTPEEVARSTLPEPSGRRGRAGRGRRTATVRGRGHRCAQPTERGRRDDDHTAGDGRHPHHEARLAPAAALRGWATPWSPTQPDDETLDDITGGGRRAPGRGERLGRPPPRFLGAGLRDLRHPPVERAPIRSRNAFPDCVVSGMANPMGIGARLWREGEEAVCQVTLGPAFEGAPGRAHGGVVAALIDETMGLVCRSPPARPSPAA